MMEAVVEVAKITCFFKVNILRLTPAQNQQGPERSCRPHLIVGESEVEQTTKWSKVSHQEVTAQSHSPTPDKGAPPQPLSDFARM